MGKQRDEINSPTESPPLLVEKETGI
jgi:hypothetical protein